MTAGSPYIQWIRSRRPVCFDLSKAGMTRTEREPFHPDAASPLLLDHGAEFEPLLEVLARRCQCSSDCIVTAHGGSMANHLVFAALLRPGSHVLVESPVFEPLFRVPQFLHAQVSFFARRAETGFALEPETIRSRLLPETRLVVLSNLHNPSGALSSRESLQAIAELAGEFDFHVLVDEVHLEYLPDHAARTASSLSPRMVSTRSLSKVFGLDALRLGWVSCSAALAERIRDVRDLYSVSTAAPSQRLAHQALLEDEGRVGSLRNRADRNRWIVDAFVQAQRGLDWIKPPAGAIGWIRLREGSADRLSDSLELEYDTAVAPGRFFGDPQYFRLGFGLDTEQLRQGLDRIDQALR